MPAFEEQSRRQQASQVHQQVVLVLVRERSREEGCWLEGEGAERQGDAFSEIEDCDDYGTDQ